MQPVSFMRTAPEALGEVSTKETRCDTCGAVEAAPKGGYTNPLSLDALLLTRPHATFFVQVGSSEHVSVEGSSYLGVEKGDILTIDRSVEPTLGKLVLAVCEGHFTLCRFTEHEGKRFLVCGQGKDTTTSLDEGSTHTLWGVVTAVVRKV